MCRAILMGLILGLSMNAEAATSKKKPPPTVAPPPRPRAPETPPSGVHSQACALEGLPEAVLAWDTPGFLWLLESGDVLYVTTLGGPLPEMGTTIRCADTKVHIETIQGGANLSVMNFDLDFASVIMVEAPQRTPEAKAFWKARRALESGDVATAQLALRPLDRADEDVAGLWVWIARIEIKAGRIPEAQQALRGLSTEVYGVSAANVEVSRMALARARDLFAAGQFADAEMLLGPAEAALNLGLEASWPEQERLDVLELAGMLRVARQDAAGATQRLEQVLAKDPKRPRSWLALADARWLNKDKKGAREAYAEATRLLPDSQRPAVLAERCPKCG